ncbi:protoheme IX farnesyltransferase [Aurantimonas aggregata]|uniref:Protoheme IX farnesyltransferase n=1 Tax=Aurantimonas aggregata TaxID=2047720 RepID=A0A6L9ME83_9HYPH|nr:heme o synthase [Aurantimonas aggregata]NDV85966.1 protoheme IX farnesyltransferase [Aurantimonas aggregata]
MTFLDATSTTAAPDRVSLAEPREFLTLLKPRVMSLVVLTAITGLVMAPGDLHPTLAFIAVLSIAMGAGASGALNMWYDADIDRLMTRTAQRPVAAGRIAPETALGFGVGLSCLSVMMLGLATNWFAAALLAFTIFFYAVIYTMGLKRRTPQNIVIGGAAGAFPPMIGWAAVTGGVAIESVVLFLIIFLWTPPHFWALALFKMKDYGSAGVPMLPNVAGERTTRNQIFLYSAVLVPVAVAPWLLGFAGPVYGIAAIVLGANFLRHAYATLKMADGDAQMVPAKKLFAFSIFYLFALFAILLVEGLVGGMVSTGGL